MNGYFLFIIFTVLPITVLSFFWQNDYKRYLRLFRKKVNPPYPLSMDEIKQEYYDHPFKFLVSIPIILKTRWVIFWATHQDQELNMLAVKVRKYFFFMILIMVASFILQILFSNI